MNPNGGYCELPKRKITKGPRHLAFHPTLKMAYVVCEKSNEVLGLDYDQELGTLTFKEDYEYSTLPPEY